jgi:hypothetical protein
MLLAGTGAVQGLGDASASADSASDPASAAISVQLDQ